MILPASCRGSCCPSLFHLKMLHWKMMSKALPWDSRHLLPLRLDSNGPERRTVWLGLRQFQMGTVLLWSSFICFQRCNLASLAPVCRLSSLCSVQKRKNFFPLNFSLCLKMQIKIFGRKGLAWSLAGVWWISWTYPFPVTLAVIILCLLVIMIEVFKHLNSKHIT